MNHGLYRRASESSPAVSTSREPTIGDTRSSFAVSSSPKPTDLHGSPTSRKLTTVGSARILGISPASPTKSSQSFAFDRSFGGSPVKADLSQRPEVDVLCFESWFREGGKQVSIVINYHVQTQTFNISLDRTVQPLSIAIYGRSGKPLDMYDLHVGAVIDVLGRTTTLKKASQETMEWIDANARSFVKTRTKKTEELARFEHVKLPARHPHGHLCSGQLALPGHVCLRLLLEDILFLQDRLDHFMQPTTPTSPSRASSRSDENKIGTFSGRPSTAGPLVRYK